MFEEVLRSIGGQRVKQVACLAPGARATPTPYRIRPRCLHPVGIGSHGHPDAQLASPEGMYVLQVQALRHGVYLQRGAGPQRCLNIAPYRLRTALGLPITGRWMGDDVHVRIFHRLDDPAGNMVTRLAHARMYGRHHYPRRSAPVRQVQPAVRADIYPTPVKNRNPRRRRFNSSISLICRPSRSACGPWRCPALASGR